MSKNKRVFLSIFLIILLIVSAVLWRILNNNLHLAPNLEIITATTVIAAIALGYRAALVVPIASMVISDLIIGNSSIFVFTWGSFVLIGLGAVLLRKLNSKPKTQIISSIGFAAASSFLFFVITNFGVWAQGWYPNTFAGLIDSYVMAIPFYKNMLIGNLILVPASIIVWQLVRVYQTRSISVVNTLVGE